MSYYSESELLNLGFAAVGQNVRLSRKASIYRPDCIAIGDNSRIDDFCVFSAGEEGIKIGKHVHIAVMVSLIGRGQITVGDLSTLSGRVSVYSSSDDYSGEYMTNPTIPEKLTNVHHEAVHIGRHVIVGCGSVILPGSVIGDGVAIGAMSLIKEQLEQNGVYAGIPAKRIGNRQLKIFELEGQMHL